MGACWKRLAHPGSTTICLLISAVCDSAAAAAICTTALLMSHLTTRHNCCRYTHLLRLLESTRDFETEEHVERADTLKAALLSNLALTAFQQEEYARCIEWCDKTLQVDPNNAKVGQRGGICVAAAGVGCWRVCGA